MVSWGVVLAFYLAGCFLGYLAGRDHEIQRRLREEAQQQEGGA